MRVYQDWEFLENGETIAPISVGMVREDGVELYHEFANAPWSEIVRHGWLMDNVYPQLDCVKSGALVKGEGDAVFKGKLAIRSKVYNFLLEASAKDHGNLELWGWYSSYDHVCLSQLFGKMINLPPFIPMWTNDLRQEFHRAGVRTWPKQETGLHNALKDAKYLKDLHRWYESRKLQAENSRGFQYGSGNVQINTF